MGLLANSPYRFCPQCGAVLKPVMLDGFERLMCTNEACDFVYWNNPTPVVAAIVEIEGKVVFTQSMGWPKEKFGIVAGFLEAGETPEEGVLREVSEELGLNGKIERFLGHYVFPERNQLIMVYHVTSEGVIHKGEELQAIKLLAPEEIHPWNKGTGPALCDWLIERLGEKSKG